MSTVSAVYATGVQGIGDPSVLREIYIGLETSDPERIQRQVPYVSCSDVLIVLLFNAAKMGSVSLIRSVISKLSREDIEATKDQGKTVLGFLVSDGDNSEALRDHQSSQLAQTYLETLRECLEKIPAAVVEEVLSQGNKYSQTLLNSFIEMGFKEAALLLLDKMRPDDLSKWCSNFSRPLDNAIRYDQAEIAWGLLQRLPAEELKWEVQARDSGGHNTETAFCYALSFDRPNIAAMIVKMMSSEDLKENKENLIAAIEYGKTDIIQMVLDKMDQVSIGATLDEIEGHRQWMKADALEIARQLRSYKQFKTAIDVDIVKV